MNRSEQPSTPPSSPLSTANMLLLDPLGGDRFRNRFNQPNSNRTLFGGQIVAQALAASDRTVPDRLVHSLHAYFLRAGNADKLVDFAVERVRDGGRFSTRRVVAEQDGAVIFSMESSYRVPLAGFVHQQPRSTQAGPDDAVDIREVLDLQAHPRAAFFFEGQFPIEIRVSNAGFLENRDGLGRHYWLRARDAEGIDDPAAHRQLLAFLSDYMLAATGLACHTTPLPGPEIFMASLDHAIWFHRPVRCDDWLLFETDSPNSMGGTSLSRGAVYDRAGQLVASLAQETLILPREPRQDQTPG